MGFSEVITALRSLSQNVESLGKHVDSLTSDVNHLTSDVKQLTGTMERLGSDVRAQTSRLAEISGQLTGSRWLIPMLVGLVMAFAGIIIGIILRR